MKWKIENLKAATIAWAITIILMLLSMFYEVLTKSWPSTLSIVFSISLVVYFGSLLYYRYRKKT